jgi:hypothetical protein
MNYKNREKNKTRDRKQDREGDCRGSDGRDVKYDIEGVKTKKDRQGGERIRRRGSDK